MLQSVLIHTKSKNIVVHILHTDLETEDTNIIKQIFDKYNFVIFKFYQIERSIFKEFPIVAEHLTIETLYRLMLADLLSKDIKKVIYIDSDIVVKEDILDVWEIDLKNFPLAAVSNLEGIMYQKLGLKSKLDYFNAGFILINLELWRKENYFQSFIDYTKNNKENIIFGDQDVLNGFLNGNWMHLHPKWNVQNSLYYMKENFCEFYSQEIYEEICANPYVIHFSGKLKPWHLFNNQNNYKEFLKVLMTIPYWRDEPFFEELTDKEAKIYIFGTGKFGMEIYEVFKTIDIPIEGFLDNTEDKWEKKIDKYTIFPPHKIIRENREKINILICSMYYKEILESIYNENYDLSNIKFYIPSY